MLGLSKPLTLSKGQARRPRLFINGKFYCGATNGVHRVADRLIRELDRLASAGAAPAGWDMFLLLPTQANWAPELGAIRPLPQRLGHSQIWEQALLPIAARNGVLLSLANLAPSCHRDKVTMVHDAQFRLSPESYPAKLRFGYRALVPAGARTSRVVLTVSDYARDTLAAFGLADPARTVVVHNGADHILETPPDREALSRLGLAAGGYCLLFGTAARYKNLAVVFDASREASPGPRLAIVGASRATLMAAGLAPPADAQFLGPVDDASLRALYESAHCLLFPSRTEGFGLPPVEAMLCGCPVIAAPAGAIPEIARDAVTYAGMDDAADWAVQIRAIGDPDIRAAKIAAGRARAAGFTWAMAGAKLVRALEPLLGVAVAMRG